MATRVLDVAPAESVVCAGFAADTYDRYVLGLLDPAERENVNRQLEQQCPICVAGVQRSINLWLVFAGSLQQVEPSADFRARLIRIAELSNRVLTVPKRYKRKPAVLISSLVVVCLILGMLLFFTFVAGRQSGRLENQRLKNELANLHNEPAENQLRPQEKLTHPTTPNMLSDLRVELAKARADKIRYEALIQSYRDSLERDRQRTNENSTLVTALESPGVRLLTFKTPEGSASTAYAFVIENAKLLFVASKTPSLIEGHQYQLWMVRKGDHGFVSLGVFTGKSDVPEVLTYQDKDVIGELGGLLVTEEPINGSATPSSARVLVTSGAAAAPPTLAPPSL